MSAKSHVFVVLYTGQTVGQAKIVAASTDPELVDFAAQRMLSEQRLRHTTDPTTEALNQGRRAALELINEGQVIR